MSKLEKLLFKLLSGGSDINFDFKHLVKILESLGFEKRIKGSHHIFYKHGIQEIINIQPKSDNKAKPYQVKQVRNLITKYNLSNNGN